MGSYKPRFEGIPDEYFPLSAGEVFKYTIFVVLIITVTLGIMIGFLFWILSTDLTNYIIAWSVAFLAFAVMMMILFYYGGKNRIREEKRLIA
jgi:O-antigen/teichoic acid export membrane protein